MLNFNPNDNEKNELDRYYLEWLIGYSYSLRKWLCEFHGNQILKFKTKVANIIGKENSLDLELAQPQVLEICLLFIYLIDF